MDRDAAAIGGELIGAEGGERIAGQRRRIEEGPLARRVADVQLGQAVAGAGAGEQRGLAAMLIAADALEAGGDLAQSPHEPRTFGQGVEHGAGAGVLGLDEGKQLGAVGRVFHPAVFVGEGDAVDGLGHRFGARGAGLGVGGGGGGGGGQQGGADGRKGLGSH